MKLPEQRRQLKPLLQDSIFAETCYFAGGCVRDYLLQEQLGRPLPHTLPYDIDISVELPNGGIRLAEYLSPHFPTAILSTYPGFGTAKLQMQDYTLEFVGTRKEQYSNQSRYPQISFGTLQDDVLRRDFSINALLMSINSGEILDICGSGLSDLHEGLIRCVGEPLDKFREDPLRMLRAFRFALRFGFRYQESTLQAMKSETLLLNTLSHRAIDSELSKLLPFVDRERIRTELASLGWESCPKLLAALNCEI